MTFYGCNWCNSMVQVIYGCDTLKWFRFCLFFRHFLKTLRTANRPDLNVFGQLRCHLHEERDALKPFGDPDFFLISR